MASLEGIVRKVIYTDLSSRFFVFDFEISEEKSMFDDAPSDAIRTNKNSKFAVVKGNFPLGVIESQRYKISGDWQLYNKKGQSQWSLTKKEYEIVRERDAQSIISYLTNMHGIGPAIAKAIVLQFGEETMRALLHPELLVQVKGISPKKAEKIATLHMNSKRLLRLSDGLSKIGIFDFKLVVRLDEFYGENAEDIIKNYPYRLYEDSICSFKIADTIAMTREVPFDANSVPRLRAAYIFALKDLAQSGNCCTGTKQLIEKMEKLLVHSKHTACKEPLSIGAATETLTTMLQEKSICRERIGDNIFCFYPKIYYAEKTSAKLLKQLAEPTDDCIANEDEFIASLEKEFGISYDSLQKEAIKAPGKSSLCIITGGPGTGKTTVTRGVIRYRQEQKPDCSILCLAPTGRAAQRMAEATGLPACTIHRGLEVDGSGGLTSFRRNEENPLEYDTIVVDEFSMVDILLLEALLKAIKPGTKLVFIGDKDQLPSVGPGCVLKDLIESGKMPVVRLALVFRQGKTSLIAQNARAIRDGDLDAIKYDEAEFIFIKREGDEAIAKACVKLFENGLRKYGNLDSVQILSPIRVLNSDKPNLTSCDYLNPIIRDVCNPLVDGMQEKRYGKLVFRVGDKVMQFTNNYDKNIMNGDYGYVHEIDNDMGIFSVKFGDRVIEYENDELNEIGLCYATTIHKSQGSEYPMVIIPVCKTQGLEMLNRNLIYTGITRAKVVVCIVGEEAAFEHAIRNLNVEQRATTLKERL